MGLRDALFKGPVILGAPGNSETRTSARGLGFWGIGLRIRGTGSRASQALCSFLYRSWHLGFGDFWLLRSEVFPARGFPRFGGLGWFGGSALHGLSTLPARHRHNGRLLL